VPTCKPTDQIGGPDLIGRSIEKSVWNVPHEAPRTWNPLQAASQTWNPLRSIPRSLDAPLDDSHYLFLDPKDLDTDSGVTTSQHVNSYRDSETPSFIETNRSYVKTTSPPAPEREHSSTDPDYCESLSLAGNGKVPIRYESYMLKRAKDPSGQSLSWERVVKELLNIPQGLLAQSLKEQATDNSSAWKKLYGRDMEGNKRKQVENLIITRNLEEMNTLFHWTLASLISKKRTRKTARAMIIETVSIEVVLQRI
jgi:hypothetical protein